jgi:hypothetical protein
LELGKLGGVDEAFGDEALAEAAGGPAALLGSRDPHEVLVGDHLVVDRQPPQQHVFCGCAHASSVSVVDIDATQRTCRPANR